MNTLALAPPVPAAVEEKEAVLVLVVALQQNAPAAGCAGNCHRAEEHNGYTSCYLPKPKSPPGCPKKEDAICAILAARIAFSSLLIRCPLK